MELLTVKEVAELKGVSERYIQRLIKDGQVYAQEHSNPANNRRQYLIPLNSLPSEIQRKYYALKGKADIEAGTELLPEIIQPKKSVTRPQRSFDEYSADEREQITFWTAVLQAWQECRAKYERKTDADPLFVAMMKLQHKDITISEDILYRKWAAYKSGDIEGLIDRRGGWNRGQCGIPEEAWNWFLTAYLDERKLSISQCYKLTLYWVKEFCPELYDKLPGERTFRRKAEKLAQAVVTMGRQGSKAFADRCAPYIVRLYDELQPNDYWVADNHTLDIISQREDGSEATHRLSLTAFMDARSSVMVGWNLTDTPCSQSTVLALRHAIMRFGIPKVCYFDNGTEFLTYDLAGRGHRSRKSQSLIDDPPPIFARLGIEFRNALPRNAKAKPIERTFNTFKGQISRLFETFCGGNVTERPESLKYTLKKGLVPLDGQLRVMISDFIDGIYNVGEYGGAVDADKGKRRIDVWNEHIRELRKAPQEDLNLLLMRSTRSQKVGRNGVYITICGEKLFYWNEHTWPLLGKEVYVRYDPAALDTVRIYDAETDRYIATVPMATSTMALFNERDQDSLKVAQEDVRRVKKAVAHKLDELKGAVPAARSIDMLDLAVRRAHAGKEGLIIQTPKIIIPVSSGDAPIEEAVGQNTQGVVIDMNKMNINAAKNRKR
ncbi:MAG: Mu transposase C-terminal domain-containing protein [Burkholderiales bacterium]